MKTGVILGGKTTEAERIDFTPLKENWSLYRLEDGTVVKLRQSVSEVFKLSGADPVGGQPVYVARSSTEMEVCDPLWVPGSDLDDPTEDL